MPDNVLGKKNDLGKVKSIEFIPNSPTRGQNWTVNVTITLSML